MGFYNPGSRPVFWQKKSEKYSKFKEKKFEGSNFLKIFLRTKKDKSPHSMLVEEYKKILQSNSERYSTKFGKILHKIRKKYSPKIWISEAKLLFLGHYQSSNVQNTNDHNISAAKWYFDNFSWYFDTLSWYFNTLSWYFDLI